MAERSFELNATLDELERRDLLLAILDADGCVLASGPYPYKGLPVVQDGIAASFKLSCGPRTLLAGTAGGMGSTAHMQLSSSVLKAGQFADINTLVVGIDGDERTLV